MLVPIFVAQPPTRVDRGSVLDHLEQTTAQAAVLGADIKGNESHEGHGGAGSERHESGDESHGGAEQLGNTAKEYP